MLNCVPIGTSQMLDKIDLQPSFGTKYENVTDFVKSFPCVYI